MTQQIPVGHGIEVDEDAGIPAGVQEFLRTLDQLAAAGIGIGIAEQNRA